MLKLRGVKHNLFFQFQSANLMCIQKLTIRLFIFVTIHKTILHHYYTPLMLK